MCFSYLIFQGSSLFVHKSAHHTFPENVSGGSNLPNQDYFTVCFQYQNPI